jgi:hypothetical protein
MRRNKHQKMKISPSHSRRLLLLTLLLTITACVFLWGFDMIVEEAAVKAYLLAAGI